MCVIIVSHTHADIIGNITEIIEGQTSMLILKPENHLGLLFSHRVMHKTKTFSAIYQSKYGSGRNEKCDMHIQCVAVNERMFAHNWNEAEWGDWDETVCIERNMDVPKM